MVEVEDFELRGDGVSLKRGVKRVLSAVVSRQRGERFQRQGSKPKQWHK